MSWKVAWAIVFLSGKWSKYSSGEISVVIIILGWTWFELLEKKQHVVMHISAGPYASLKLKYTGQWIMQGFK